MPEQQLMPGTEAGDDLKGYIENHIKPNIGSVPLGKLSSLQLQKLYKKLLAKGRVDRIEAKSQPKGLRPKTVRNIRR